MKGLPRATFDKLEKRHTADKYCKRFGHWDHLIAMLYALLSGTTGLRPLETGVNAHVAHHYHLGTSSIKRSTLADANEKRPAFAGAGLQLRVLVEEFGEEA
jgi:putative transposase